jgi:uncharacterized membrane protein YjjP (DUF1212 family)
MKLNIDSQYFAFPTGIFASFKEEGHEHTRMDRLEPGKINLSKLLWVDEIVDQVIWNEIKINEGTQKVRKITNELPLYNSYYVTLSYALIAFAISIFLKGTLLDACVAAILATLIGFFTETVKEERIDSIVDGIVSFFVALSALYLGSIYQLNINIVILSSIIMLVPGLMLTLAIGELASQNLTAGTARIMGSLIILLKISFGVYLAYQISRYFGWQTLGATLESPNVFILTTSLVIAGVGLSLSFQARVQEFFWIVLAAVLSYFCSQFFLELFGHTAGYLCAGAAIGSLSNIYSRMMNRPALIFLLPAIILLVPGSIGFKGLNLLFDRNVLEGFNSIFNMVTIGISLVSGTYFGALLVKPRRTL